MIARVYASISAVTAALAGSGIAKARFNLAEGYAYRSIDDVVTRLAPLLAEHKLCVLPRVLERTITEREGLGGEALVSVSLKVAYDIVSAEDGSTHTIAVVGEALDGSDKGTAKALQSAYKYAMIQAFAIPVTGSEDADSRSPRLKAQLLPTGPLPTEPVQGWEQWTRDVAEMIAACESGEALTRVQDTYRPELAALQRERTELYATLGEAIGERRAQFVQNARDVARPEARDLMQSAREVAAGGTSVLAQPARDRAECDTSELVQSARDRGAPETTDVTQAARDREGSHPTKLVHSARDQADRDTTKLVHSAREVAAGGTSVLAQPARDATGALLDDPAQSASSAGQQQQDSSATRVLAKPPARTTKRARSTETANA